MADVSGPVSTLPGSRWYVHEGTMCDNHPDRPAARRVQGATDSFGAEFIDLCQECIDELKAHEAEDRAGRCDWCKQEATDLRLRRDYDEGSCGPVYSVCVACVKRDNERAAAELDEYDDYDRYAYDEDA